MVSGSPIKVRNFLNLIEAFDFVVFSLRPEHPYSFFRVWQALI